MLDSPKKRGMAVKKTIIVHTVTAVLAVAAMVLPIGAVCRFTAPAESGVYHETVETYSYFDLLPYGYANVGPLLTAILSCVLLAVLLLSFVIGEKKGLHIAMTVLSAAATITSLLPLFMFGIGYYTPTALTITYLLACSVLMSVQRLTGRFFEREEEQEETEE